jgi:hypothetical protein
MILSDNYYNAGIVAKWHFETHSIMTDEIQTLNIINEILLKAQIEELIITKFLKLSYMSHVGTSEAQIVRIEFDNIKKLILDNQDFIFDVSGDGNIYTSHDTSEKITLGDNNVIVSKGLLNITIWYSKNSVLRCTISTKADIWLPFDLKGRPQTEIYAANLGRLSDYMISLSGIGLFLVPDDNYDFQTYCLVSGFCMQNYRDSSQPYGIVDIISEQDGSYDL